MIHVFYEPQEGILCQVISIFTAAGLITAEVIDVVVVSGGNIV